MESIHITAATSKDVTQLVALSQVLGYTTDEESVKQRFEKINSSKDHLLLIAKVDEKVIGFCHGYVRLLVEVPVAVEIGGLVVIAEWQGKGIAKQLIKKIEAWAVGNNIHKIVLSSNVIRVKAHGFYEHVGYNKIKQQFAFEKVIV